jgi:hypothetical protein
MTDNYHNVIISTKHKRPSDTNSSVYVKLLDNIFVNNENEYLEVSLQSFNMIKSFYSSQSGLNDHFQVIFRLPGDPYDVEVFDRYISEGNYDIRSFIAEIKSLTNNALFDITYNVKQNKFIYKNLFQEVFEVYLKPINAGIFLGMENGVEYKIEKEGTISSKFINLSGYSQMLIKLEGDINIENTISNVKNDTFEYDRVLAILPLQDIAPMDSILYRNDGANIFKHRIGNTSLPSLTIKIVNEDGIEFPQMSDWIMMLRFEKGMKDNRQLTKLSQILNDILYYIMRFFVYLQIPSNISVEDLAQ